MITFSIYNVLDTNRLSTNLKHRQKKLASISTHLLFTEPDGMFGHNQASFNTTDVELRKFSVLANWLYATFSKSSLSKSSKWQHPNSHFFFQVHQVQPELFLLELAPSQFSLSALYIKVLYTEPSASHYSRDSHSCVRKQLLLIEGRGWCNFSFKDLQ